MNDLGKVDLQLSHRMTFPLDYVISVMRVIYICKIL